MLLISKSRVLESIDLEVVCTGLLVTRPRLITLTQYRFAYHGESHLELTIEVWPNKTIPTLVWAAKHGLDTDKPLTAVNRQGNTREAQNS